MGRRAPRVPLALSIKVNEKAEERDVPARLLETIAFSRHCEAPKFLEQCVLLPHPLLF